MQDTVNNKTVFIGIGSNLNNKVENIKTAINKIKKDNYIFIEKISSFYISKPWGNPSLDNFVNAAFKGKTNLTPVTLLKYLKEIERDMGRVQSEKRFLSRIIDLDILLYDNISIDKPNLKIPHSEITAREFVLVPLLELAPDLVHPITNQPISFIYNEFKKSCVNLEGRIINKCRGRPCACPKRATARVAPTNS